MSHLLKYLEKQLNKAGLLLILFNFYFVNNSVAQINQESSGDNIVNQQIWIDFYPHYFVNERLEYYGDFGYRSIVTEKSWGRIYAHPSLKYHLKNKHWEVQTGVGVFYIFNKGLAD